MKAKKMKTSALLMLSSLTVLATSLQAADVNPAWVEYTSTPPAATSEPAVAKPASATPVVMPAANAATPTAVTEPTPAAATSVANDSPAGGNGNGMTVSAVVTPRIFAFDYFKGVDDNLTHYLERYDYRDGMAGDRRSGVFADIDLSLNMNNGDRDVFVIERQGFGQDNHRGMARFDDDEITLSGSYNHTRSATGGIDYLFSPAVVPGASLATFTAGNQPFVNSTATTDYRIDRTSYDAGFKVKPTLLTASSTARNRCRTRFTSSGSPCRLRVSRCA